MNHPVRVLLVEDNEADVMLVEEALTDFTPAVALQVVRDGEQALRYLRERHASDMPRFVLLDAHTPRMDGLELLRELRCDARLTALPVVVYSSSNNPEDAARVYAAGGNAYVPKPVTFDEFVGLIHVTMRFWVNVVGS